MLAFSIIFINLIFIISCIVMFFNIAHISEKKFTILFLIISLITSIGIIIQIFFDGVEKIAITGTCAAIGLFLGAVHKNIRFKKNNKKIKDTINTISILSIIILIAVRTLVK